MSLSLLRLIQLWSGFGSNNGSGTVVVGGVANYYTGYYITSESGVQIDGTSLSSSLSNPVPLQQIDISFYYSNNDKRLTAGNSDQANPPTIDTLSNVCLGGWISSSIWLGSTSNDLFDNITGVDNQNQASDYRCIFIANSNQYFTLYSAAVFLPSQVSGGANMYIAVDPAGVVPINQSGTGNYQSIRMDNSTTEPTYQGQSLPWSMAATRSDAISIGDLTPQSCAAIWFKRTAKNTAPLNNDGVTIRVEGDIPE